MGIHKTQIKSILKAEVIRWKILAVAVVDRNKKRTGYSKSFNEEIQSS